MIVTKSFDLLSVDIAWSIRDYRFRVSVAFILFRTFIIFDVITFFFAKLFKEGLIRFEVIFTRLQEI